MLQRLSKHKIRYSMAAAYCLTILLILIFIRAFWTPDLIFIALLGFFIILGEGKQFLIYFLPFVILLLSYEKLRSLAPILNSHVHFTEMIQFDRWLFGGTTPPQLFQQWFFHGYVRWYDFALYLIYMMHFLVPLLLAVIIWKTKLKHYWEFVTALLLLSFAGFITYVIFPAAPPWMASERGILHPSIVHVSTSIWAALGVNNFSTYYNQLSPNLVAAVPSLHAAYPFLFALIIRKIWGNKWFALAMIYPLTVWFGVMYLGEHYAFDVIVGVIYAYLSYLAAPYALRFIQKKYKQLRHQSHELNA
jgi:membrane-associated phospholipid phosphatase